jgi:eukaryotic-like serine/threonine-protein kinase
MPAPRGAPRTTAPSGTAPGGDTDAFTRFTGAVPPQGEAATSFIPPGDEGATSFRAPEKDAPTSFIPPGDDGATFFRAPEKDVPTSFIPLSDDGATSFRAPEKDAPTSFIPPSDDGVTSYRAPEKDAPTSFVPPPGDGAEAMGRAAREAQPPSHATTGPLVVGQSFGHRYHIIRALGVGGMGAVYQAWDAELGVTVAIKVIRPDVMADPTAAAEIERRFKRELLLARQVTHKNVVRIHDLGDINGIKYITMPYVDGADLATVLKRDGQLPVTRVLHIARSIASGLVEAHKAGVVHRDLKPANIMISAEDEAMIMDFGIARSTGTPTGQAVPGPNTIVRNLKAAALNIDATVFGAVVGTVEYMAPEQAKGVHVDQRADVYAFGLILYDLLLGHSRSATAENPIVELQARMKQAPPRIKTLVPEVPEAVDAIIARCLEPDPDKRFQTTEEIARALAALDDEGKPIPIPPRFSKKMMAAAAVAVVSLVSATWYFTRTPPPPKQHDPVLVLIADFQNSTNDASFTRTLEPMVKLALEGASFINAYDRSRIRSTFGVPAPDTLDEANARELAAKQGVNIVLAGSIALRDRGYEITARASDAVSGKEVASVKGRASNKDEVLPTATRLVTTIRKALGDETDDSQQLLAMRSVSAKSLEMVRHYATAIEAQANGKFEEARQSYLKTVEIDPKFALGYQGLATMSRNLGRLQDANKYIDEALKNLDGVTEREQFAIRGLAFANAGDYGQCKQEFGQLVARYAADPGAHNNSAYCLSRLRETGKAVEEMRQAVKILPKRMIFRGNLTVYSVYAGDFQGAEQEARAVQEPTDLITLGLAFAQLGQGQFPQAVETYQKLASISARGASWTGSGLADLALYEGRFADAVKRLDQGAAADVAANNPDKAARKFTTMGYVQLLRRQLALAAAAAEKALANSNAVPIRFLAGRILVDANGIAKAKTLAAGLAKELPAEPQAYGKILEGEIALKNGDARQAVKILGDANSVLDTWLGHFDLGRAYLELGAFLQASSEFDRCINRRGEALSLLLDEEPTYGYFPMAYYYQGRVREGMKSAAAAESYREYLKIRGKSSDDPLLPDVRKRAGN